MWDVRGNCCYYYRHKRANGRAFRVYVGTGAKAEEAALEDLQRYVEREYGRYLREQYRAAHKAAEAPVLQLCQSTDLIARSALVASGFYQHAHGEWRPNRETRRRRNPPARTDR